MKPDWKDAPEWARYLAMTETGAWFWFENKPEWRTTSSSSGMKPQLYSSGMSTPADYFPGFTEARP